MTYHHIKSYFLNNRVKILQTKCGAFTMAKADHAIKTIDKELENITQIRTAKKAVELMEWLGNKYEQLKRER